MEITQYACAMPDCTSAPVDELADLERCERCQKRICEGHARKRLIHVLCSGCCDLIERVLLEMLAPHLSDLAEKIRLRAVTAEDVVLKLGTLMQEACQIEEGE